MPALIEPQPFHHRRVLVIDDAQEICQFVSKALQQLGLEVFTAHSLNQGLMEASTRQPDTVILDLGLPDGDGQSFIPRFRSWSDAPVIVLSARSDEADKVQALNSGADDYLCKPFGIEELLARVRVALRRHLRHSHEPETQVQLGEVLFDRRRQQLSRNGEPVHLTKTELKLLNALLEQPGKVLTQQSLLKQVWGPTFVEHGHYVRTYMKHLRNKIEAEPANPQYLLTEIGIGYRLVSGK
ncbi:response regulator [Shewanella algae]|uniref:response regulator n=1 Tax=Shewanella algae TaxID=38313 RepID=UPI0031F4D7EF